MRGTERARRIKLEGVLLDVDGTLIDSNDAHARSWSEALREFGRDVPAHEVRPLIGMGGDKLLPRLLGVDADSDTGRAFAKRRAEIFRERYVPHLRLTRGARDLVKRLRAEGLKLIIATSAADSELDVMLKQVGLDDLIEKRTSSGDADRSKPDPDIVQAALEKASLSPKTAIMLGDTPYDVEAAARARVPAVALLCGGWDADALSGAIAIYENPTDVVQHFTSSPFSSAWSSLDRSETRR
jgi:HAD superfamily hydrolase (TIGR01509 family)